MIFDAPEPIDYSRYRELKLSLDDGIMTVTLSNPGKRNAVTMRMAEELSMIWEDVWSDTNARAAILTGDLLATIDEMRAIDPTLLHATERPGVPALTAVLEHAFAGDLVRFSLSGEAIALRRRIGSVWTA